MNGLKVTVVFPANRYAKHTITVADPVDRLTAVLDTTPAGNEICVTFQNVTGVLVPDVYTETPIFLQLPAIHRPLVLKEIFLGAGKTYPMVAGPSLMPSDQVMNTEMVRRRIK